jgi:hypothetical protein
MSVRLRPRNAWEALDLGLELVRTNARALYGTWLLAYVPVAALVIAVLWERPFLAWLVLWWLKPLFDRLALAVTARRLFGDAAPARAVVGSLPAIAWRSGIIGALTWRRFDFARSLHLPVYQLERLSGKAARTRIRVLDREARGPAVWLSFLFLMTELIFGLGVSLLITFLVPVQAPVGTLLEGWFLGRFDQGVTGTVLGALAACVVEPFYVACGFTLYLQRRTMLEGWDIELRFRQLTERVEKARSHATAIAASLFAAFALLLVSPVDEARAQQPPPRAQGKAADAIHEILKDPDFGRKSTRTRIRYVGPEWQGKSEARPFDWSWIQKLSAWMGELSRAAAWVAGGLALCFVLYHVARYIRTHRFGALGPRRPDFLFGMDVRPESLPDDVAATAEALARDSRTREALSLLYRASLVRFMDAGVEFRQGDTEGDCMRRVEAAEAPARKAYFHRLVNAWQALAYAHHAVEVDAVVTLARAWRGQFEDDGAGHVDARPQPA